MTEQAVLAHPEIAWRRLPPKMIVVAPATLLLKFLPAFVIVLIFGGSESPVRIWITVAIAVLAVSAGLVRWRTTRYRITPERVELHSGLVQRKRLSVPRDRIRTVDLTSTFLHQMFALSVVKVGTGQSSGGRDGGLHLDAVTTPEAERLRQELLAAHTATAPQEADAPAVAPPSQELDRLDWASLRYAPLTISSLAAIGALAAAAWNLLQEANVDPRSLPGVSAATGELESAPLWAAVLVGAVVLLVVLVVGSLVLFVERWWRFRLTREPDGTLRVRRGLLTQRSLSVSERRLRGVAVAEPILVRIIGRGAQASALSVGLHGSEGEKGGSGGVLQPPVPRRHAHDVAAAAMRLDDRVTDGPLHTHPRGALTRRLTRAVVPSLVPVVLAWWLGSLWDVSWLGPVSLVLPVLAVPLALDRYRSLGNRLDARFLIGRHGSLLRATTALQRDGVIGWRIRQSWFQRRAGVVTLDAVTAAGQGVSTVLDVGPARAAEIVTDVTPEAVAPFRP
ncbi:PH domain-containing protein [Pseudonocardia endophytica]|uniref:Putative membrane protein n=1 Tax=Pseudonocardia endophytica TaxID=401976 RepID=A0A4R1HX09_PSEEN|nr:PH domain-containing protein [Pseudonocardia endophytica]TCK25625.1 putative membrane protein [Pseudonocardia endophytica]